MNTWAQRLIARVTRREPNMLIGGAVNPYLKRWFVIPRNRFFNIYLHQFLRSDDDRALHDHPWINCSILLRGTYVERTAGRIEYVRIQGDVIFRLSGKFAHRIELYAGPVWTLFITGPRYREWGFLCPQGWRHWKIFTDSKDSGAIGRGCD